MNTLRNKTDRPHTTYGSTRLALALIAGALLMTPEATQAQVKGSALPVASSLSMADRVMMVTDPSGTPTTKTATLTLLKATMAAGSGDVVGPASAVNNRVVFFDGTTGKLIKDSGLTLSGTNTGDQDLSGYLTSSTAAATYSPLAHHQAWSTITSTPTTLAGYGISDAITAAAAAAAYQPQSSALTTLSSATAAGLALMDDASTTDQRATLGLGNVDNTNDAGKPISTLTQAALNTKAPTANATFTGTHSLPAAVITSANLRNSAALSVIGRSVNSSGVPADIVASSNDRVMMRSGNTLGFGIIPLDTGSFFSGLLPVSKGGTGVASNTGTAMLVALGVLQVNSAAVAQIVDISMGGVATGGAFFDISVVGVDYRVWFQTGADSPPSDDGRTLLMVSGNDSTALTAALNTTGAAATDNAGLVSVMSTTPGACAAPDALSSGLTITVTVTGEDEILIVNPEITSRLP